MTLQEFKGIKLKLLTIHANVADGYGIEILCLTITCKGRICLISDDYCLFALNYYRGRWRRSFYMSLCGLSYTWQREVEAEVSDEDDLL
jgi:hypothetical protein